MPADDRHSRSGPPLSVRIALLGGTFDPPHVGHLLAASDAVDHLDLDRLVFIPAARQPLKTSLPTTPPDDRLRMVELMASGDGRFAVDEVEIRRTGLSYSVETLEEYARRLPAAERFLLLGGDAFLLLDQWKEPARVVSLARIVVLARDMGEGVAGLTENEVTQRVREIGGPRVPTPLRLQSRRVDVSSTEIRARVRAGKSIRGFVADAVAEYIESHGLYR